MPGFVGLFRALRDSPIEAWPIAAYDEPYLMLDGGRFRPSLLFVTEPAMLERIFVGAPEIYDKGDIVRRRMAPAIGDSVLIAPADRWRAQRRITAPMFAPRRVDGGVAGMADVVKTTAAKLRPGAVIDMLALMSELTYRIVAHAAFSDDGVSDPMAFSHAIATYFATLGRPDLASYLALPAWIPTPDRIRARPALALFHREISGVIARRRKMMQDRPLADVPDDLLTRLLTATDPVTGETLSSRLVHDNVMTFLAAGHETTANALTWTLFLLSESPEWDRAVSEEAAQCDPGYMDDLRKLPHMTSVIEEAMRLYPPVPFLPRQASRDDRLGDVAVRRGTLIFASPYVSHRHTAHWRHPDVFDPGRFSPAVRGALRPFQYFPFGAGPRVCMGAHFAMQEMRIVLSVLLARFRFVSLDPERVMPRATITLAPAGGLPMRVERRMA